MYNEKLANRLIETMLAGYEGGIDGMVELHPYPYIDRIDERKTIGEIAFSLVITEQCPEGPTENLEKIQSTMEGLIKKIEQHIMTGEDIGIDLGNYASIVLKDLIHIDKKLRDASGEYTSRQKEIDKRLDEAVKEFCNRMEDKEPDMVAAIREAHKHATSGDTETALEILREKAKERGFILPED